MPLASNIPRRLSPPYGTRRLSTPYGTGGTGGFSFRRGGFRRISDPNFSPIDRSGLTNIKRRMELAEQEAANPLGSAAAQSALQAINAGAQRQAASERGQALGRATQSGQAGFGGALAQTAGDIAARQGESITAASGDLAMQIFQQARAEGASLAEAQARMQNEITGIETQRSQIRADIAKENARLQAEYEFRVQQDMMEQARLAEQARQFNVGQGFQEKRFGYEKEQDKYARETDEERYRDEKQRRREQMQEEQQRYREQQRLAEEERRYSRFRESIPLSEEEDLEERYRRFVPGFRLRQDRGPVGIGSGGFLRDGEQGGAGGSGAAGTRRRFF